MKDEAAFNVQPDVREDLRWLLLSPPLLSARAADLGAAGAAQVQGFTAPERLAIGAWLCTLDEAWLRDQVAHTLSLPPHAQRLGRYAEALLAVFLQHGPTHRAAVMHLPVRTDAGTAARSDHTTRGEIDALLHDAAGQPWHWELAVKFFLCVASGAVAQPSDFVGPDRLETLDNKLRKLFDRQLRLPPPPPWDREAWQPAAYARGWLFYRHGRPVPACAALAPDHLRGAWLPATDCGQLPPGRYVAVPRMQWMRPLSMSLPMAGDAGLEPGLQLSALPAWVARAAAPSGRRQRSCAVLVARVQHGRLPGSGDEGWCELDRWFIVPPGWEHQSDPERTTALGGAGG